MITWLAICIYLGMFITGAAGLLLLCVEMMIHRTTHEYAPVSQNEYVDVDDKATLLDQEEEAAKKEEFYKRAERTLAVVFGGACVAVLIMGVLYLILTNIFPQKLKKSEYYDINLTTPVRSRRSAIPDAYKPVAAPRYEPVDTNEHATASDQNLEPQPNPTPDTTRRYPTNEETKKNLNNILMGHYSSKIR
ncbi:hypothetical protein NEDG_01347 [Nematocida displodere]|uniref:Uncharacterized protein n=1 Tax=Nematocida displodere TaxID=1805483 RepID=A0A177EBE7_9MICR|nr:hypothetical protein NEDG_01347 [Nematocida displodere]